MQDSESFDPKRVKTIVGDVRLMCPEHRYPIHKDGAGNPVCFHHTCKFNWPGLLVQLPAAFEPSQAAALLNGLPLAEAVQTYLDIQRADRAYARSLRSKLPDPVTRAARSATRVPAGAAG